MPVKLNLQYTNWLFDCGKLWMILIPFLWWVCRHILVLRVLLLVDWLRSLLKKSLGIHLHRLKGSTFSIITSFSLLLVRSRTLIIWLCVEELLKWQGVVVIIVTNRNVMWLILKLDLLFASFLTLLFPGCHFHLWWVLSEDALWSAETGSRSGTSLCSRTSGDPWARFVIIVTFTQIWLEGTVFLLLLKLSDHGVFILSRSVVNSFLGSLNYGFRITWCHLQWFSVQHGIERVFFLLILLLIIPVLKLVFVLLLGFCMLIQSLGMDITSSERHFLLVFLIRATGSISTDSIHDFISLLESSNVWSILELLVLFHANFIHFALLVDIKQTIFSWNVHSFELLVNLPDLVLCQIESSSVYQIFNAGELFYHDLVWSSCVQVYRVEIAFQDLVIKYFQIWNMLVYLQIQNGTAY